MNVDKLIQDFLKENKQFLVAYIFFMIAYPLTSVLLPKYYGQLFDDLKERKPLRYKPALILLVTTNVMYTILDKIDSVFLPKLQKYVRTHIVQVVLQNYKDKFQEQEIGTLISKIIKLPIVIRELARQIRNYIVPISLILVVTVVRFMAIDKRIGAFALLGISTIIGLLTPLVHRCIRIASDVDEGADTIHEDISELFDNLMDVYAMGTYDKEMSALERSQTESVRLYRHSFDCSNRLRVSMNFFGILLFISLAVYSYRLYTRKEMSLVNMMNIVLTSKYIISKIGSLSGEMPDLLFNLGSYIRTQEFLEKFTDDSNNTATEKYKFPSGRIVYKGVGVAYGEKKVVADFNLVVEPGESIALVGKIGSGKSSLVKALLKLVSYTGKIYIDEKDVANLDSSSVRSQVLYVRQNPLPFNRTLYENIVYGNEGVTKDEVLGLFAKYDLHSFFRHSLDSPVGKKGGKLSGGQKMVMFLLRVMIQNKKKIVIIDEPTSSLDRSTALKVIEIIKDVTKKQTTIIITHDEKVSSVVGRVVNLKGATEE